MRGFRIPLEPCSSQLVYLESTSDSGAQRFFGSLLNAAIFVVMIVVVTVIFVLLYKYRCLKVRWRLFPPSS
jgi:presenilin 1